MHAFALVCACEGSQLKKSLMIECGNKGVEVVHCGWPRETRHTICRSAERADIHAEPVLCSED